MPDEHGAGNRRVLIDQYKEQKLTESFTGVSIIFKTPSMQGFIVLLLS